MYMVIIQSSLTVEILDEEERRSVSLEQGDTSSYLCGWQCIGIDWLKWLNSRLATTNLMYLSLVM